MAQAIILAMVGGAFGSATRYLITHLSSDLSKHHGFPFGTLVVNVVGSLAVGYILTWSADHTHDRWRLLAATGFCGGFTTFSAFSQETFSLLSMGKVSLALLYIISSIVIGLLATLAGVSILKFF